MSIFNWSNSYQSLKANIFLCLYINTRTLNANNSFNGTCPFSINYLTDTSANGGIPATVTNITAGLYLARTPATSFNVINLAHTQASHPLPACRTYYRPITMQPAMAEEYILNNRAKKCI